MVIELVIGNPFGAAPQQELMSAGLSAVIPSHSIIIPKHSKRRIGKSWHIQSKKGETGKGRLSVRCRRGHRRFAETSRTDLSDLGLNQIK